MSSYAESLEKATGRDSGLGTLGDKGFHLGSFRLGSRV